MPPYLDIEIQRIAMTRALKDVPDLRDAPTVAQAFLNAGFTAFDFDRHGATAIKREHLRRDLMWKKIERACG